jgi:ABC-type amino acid transport substrate-binding protein
MNLFFVAFISAASVIGVYGQQYGSSSPLRVLTNESPPYIVKAADGGLSGFLVDYLKLVMADAGLTYTLSLGTGYGTEQADGSWDGVVGALIADKADVAATDITISSARDKVIDFTTPWLYTQLKYITLATAPGTSTAVYTAAAGTKYAIQQGVEEGFLKASTDPKLKAIYANIVANNGIVMSVKEGIDKVKSGGWTYIENLDIVQASLNADSTLAASKESIWVEFYAFGVQQGSPLRDQIGISMSRVNNGQLQALFAKYGIVQ